MKSVFEIGTFLRKMDAIHINLFYAFQIHFNMNCPSTVISRIVLFASGFLVKYCVYFLCPIRVLHTHSNSFSLIR